MEAMDIRSNREDQLSGVTTRRSKPNPSSRLSSRSELDRCHRGQVQRLQTGISGAASSAIKYRAVPRTLRSNPKDVPGPRHAFPGSLKGRVARRHDIRQLPGSSTLGTPIPPEVLPGHRSNARHALLVRGERSQSRPSRTPGPVPAEASPPASGGSQPPPPAEQAFRRPPSWACTKDSTPFCAIQVQPGGGRGLARSDY